MLPSPPLIRNPYSRGRQYIDHIRNINRGSRIMFGWLKLSVLDWKKSVYIRECTLFKYLLAICTRMVLSSTSVRFIPASPYIKKFKVRRRRSSKHRFKNCDMGVMWQWAAGIHLNLTICYRTKNFFLPRCGMNNFNWVSNRAFSFIIFFWLCEVESQKSEVRSQKTESEDRIKPLRSILYLYSLFHLFSVFRLPPVFCLLSSVSVFCSQSILLWILN